MDDQEKLRYLFPRGSKDFFDANIYNETKTIAEVPNTYTQHYQAKPLGKAIIVEQEKVKHFDREGTDIEIEWPD
jgi:hypothetical protein